MQKQCYLNIRSKCILNALRIRKGLEVHLRSWPHSVQVTFIMRALIIKRCSPSLTIDSTFKSNLDMHLHGIYIYMKIIVQFIKPIVSHLNVVSMSFKCHLNII